jgi:hypothetical protein
VWNYLEKEKDTLAALSNKCPLALIETGHLEDSLSHTAQWLYK